MNKNKEHIFSELNSLRLARQISNSVYIPNGYKMLYMATDENTNNRRILHHLFIKSNEYIENCYFITSAVCRFAEMHPKCPPQVLEIVRDFKFEKYFDEYLDDLTKQKITRFEFPSSVRLPFKILFDLAKTIATQYMMPLLASNEMFNGEMEKLIFSRSINRLGQYKDTDADVTNRLLGNGTTARPESDDAIQIENIVNGSNKDNIQMKISADGYVVIDHEETERLRKEREEEEEGNNKILVDIHEPPPSSGRSSSSGNASDDNIEMEITSEEFAEIDGLKVYEECSDIESISTDDDDDNDDDSDNYDEGYYEITNSTSENKIACIPEVDEDEDTIEEFIIKEAAAASENLIKDDDDNVVVNENFIAQEVVLLNSHTSSMNKLNSIEKNDSDAETDDKEVHQGVENVNNNTTEMAHSFSMTLDHDDKKTTTTSDEEEEDDYEIEPESEEQFDMFGLPILKNNNKNSEHDEDFYKEMRRSYNIM